MNESDKRLCERIVRGRREQGFYAAWTFICGGTVLAALALFALLLIPGAKATWFVGGLAVLAVGAHLTYENRLHRIIKHQAKALVHERPSVSL